MLELIMGIGVVVAAAAMAHRSWMGERQIETGQVSHRWVIEHRCSREPGGM